MSYTSIQMSSAYQSPTEAATRTGLSRAYVCRLATQGRIAGAIRVGRSWGIPADWQPPKLERGNPNFKKQSKK